MQVHCRCGQGCSFVADESGRFLTFPDFIVEVDDSKDCLVDFSPVPSPTVYAYNELAGGSKPEMHPHLPFSSGIGRARLMHRPRPTYNLMSLRKEPLPDEATLLRPAGANNKQDPHLCDLISPSGPDRRKDGPII